MKGKLKSVFWTAVGTAVGVLGLFLLLGWGDKNDIPLLKDAQKIVSGDWF